MSSAEDKFQALVSALQGFTNSNTSTSNSILGDPSVTASIAAANSVITEATSEWNKLNPKNQGDRLTESLNALGPARVNMVNRTPWVISTTEWLNPPDGSAPKGIVLAANPTDVTWSMALRSSVSKNLGGTVTHVWPNTGRNTYYDEIRLSINMQSTSVIPVLSDNGEWIASPGIANLYGMIRMLDQPRITQSGRANLVSIQYASNLFPSLTLLGQFDPRGLTFTDSSQDPNRVTSWSLEFIVYDSSPRLSNNFGQGFSSREDELIRRFEEMRIKNDPKMSSKPLAQGRQKPINQV
jgi:hypothetical protein